jgi:hypothetical protein|tara:strand:- start:2172 stop:2408 length:237 start_codon:yes stop_codon:yes gene_type:complete
MVDFTSKVLNAQIKQADAMIEKHKINVEVLTKNAVGVAEHPDTMETVEKELERISYWTDIKSAALNNFDFENKRTLTE